MVMVMQNRVIASGCDDGELQCIIKKILVKKSCVNDNDDVERRVRSRQSVASLPGNIRAGNNNILYSIIRRKGQKLRHETSDANEMRLT